MSVSGIVVVPKRGREKDVEEMLRALPGVEVQGRGSKGIAAVLEADSSAELQIISEEIKEWKEVIDFHLAYFNCEQEEGER